MRELKRVGDLPVLLLSGVLIDQRGPGGAVTHPGHKVGEARAGTGREGVPGVQEVVEVEAGSPIPATAAVQLQVRWKLERRNTPPLAPVKISASASFFT